jgi:hypothetical protein
VSCFYLSTGAYGNKSGSRVFEPLVGLVEEHHLFGGGSVKGFHTGDLGRTADFDAVANGSQQMGCEVRQDFNLLNAFKASVGRGPPFHWQSFCVSVVRGCDLSANFLTKEVAQRTLKIA